MPDVYGNREGSNAVADYHTARGLKQVPRTVKTEPEPEQPKTTRRRKIKYNLFGIGKGMDMPMFFLIIILLSIGLVMLFSASFAYCYFYYGDSYYFIRRQVIFAIMGIIIMLGISLFDYHRLHRLAWPVAALAAMMLVMTLVFRGTAIAPTKGGEASRWLDLGFVEFQPSEIAKFALILLFAHLISQRVHEMQTLKKGFAPFMFILAVYAGLIAMERHISATIIIVMLGVIIMFIGGTRLRYLAVTGGVGIAGVGGLLLLSNNFSYALQRIQSWLETNSVIFQGQSTTFDIYQTKQSLYAIGSGQLLGVGLGQSRQKYLYLPEPHNDFIFSVVCEELGFVGALIIILLFALLIWRGVYIALHAKDKFGTILALGIIFQIGIQIVLNICVVTNTLPNTGIGLPLFSYGGTSLIILLSELGVLLQISRSANIEKT